MEAATQNDISRSRVQDASERRELTMDDHFSSAGFWPNCARRMDKPNMAVTTMMLVWFSIDTDHNYADKIQEAAPAFFIVWVGFCMFFFFHLCSTVLALRTPTSMFRLPWVTLNFVLTTVLPIGLVMGSSIGRLCLYAQFLRVLGLVRAIPELFVLLKGLAAASRSAFWLALLWCLLTYVFAIVITREVGDEDKVEHLFPDVPQSMHTLLTHCILLSNIGELLNHLHEVNGFAEVVVLIFTCISFTLLVLCMGVICEICFSVCNSEKDGLMEAYMKGSLHACFESIDRDYPGMITGSEFLTLLQQEEVVRILSQAGIDIGAVADTADEIFEDLPEGKLSFDALCQVLMTLRGDRNAKVQDLLALRRSIRNDCDSQAMMKKLEKIENSLRDLLESNSSRTPVNVMTQ